jgi:hypothetical protein
VQNHSADTLYLYRAYFKPGYRSDKTDWSKPKTAIFYHWANDALPDIAETERQNVRGEYVMSPVDQQGQTKRSAFLEPGASAYYRIQLNPTSAIKASRQTLEQHRAGLLTLHLVHGTRPLIFETQL